MAREKGKEEMLAGNDDLQTMRIAFAHICGGEDLWVALGNFTNDFLYYFPEEREGLIAEPIVEPEDGTPELHRWAVFCAASADYLCGKYDLPRPQWVHNPAFAPLDEPWFFAASAATKQDIREHFVAVTPEAFACRNIFCGDKVYLDKREAAAVLREKLLQTV